MVRSKEAEVEGSALSPMMRQYWDVKSQYPDALLFFRVGDFYEMFDTDAQVAARELDIVLTGRPEASYPNGRMPMAGVPYRSYEAYVAKLLGKGYSVAICDQVGIVGAEKGPVERQVKRVLTPGTVLESHLLPARENNYLAAIVKNPRSQAASASTGANAASAGDTWGLAFVDASCGEFFVTELSEESLILELGRLRPAEVLVPIRVVKPGPDEVVPREVLELPEIIAGEYRFKGRPAMFFQPEPAQRRILSTLEVSTLDGFGCQDKPLAIGAAGAILEYLERTQGGQKLALDGISTYTTDGYLVLDANTRKNLELTETSRERVFNGSLLWSIDQTETAMGSRMLRKWLLKPLLSVDAIVARQDAIKELLEPGFKRDDLVSLIGQLSDLERLSVRLTSQAINPKELLSVASSLAVLPAIAAFVSHARSPYLSALKHVPPALLQFGEKVTRAINPEPPRELTEGGIFAPGYDAELDEVRMLLGGGKQWIEDLQRKEQERTGIKSLKVNFNRTFGYYIEITNANQGLVPADYIRKQTLTNAERYITPDLKEYEAKILNAEKNQSDIEYKLFIELRKELAALGPDLHKIAHHLANLDALISLAKVALERKFICPVVDNSKVLTIKQGRHPVLEKLLPMGKYVANDVKLLGDCDDHQLVILTGPNMAGKSSYLRQVALIVILAQIGSFVPAREATIGVVDRVFTRIGAVDDLTQGQSTFLVEMSETTQCCLSASSRSLILLDEVGRGTSTYDGVSIAWGVAEYLAKEVRARTIFATHYHELNGLSNYLPQIVNYQVLVKETDGRVEFIRTVVPGGASRSFGVQVARMAGLPMQIIERAQYLINQMEKKGVAGKILDGPRLRNIPIEEVMQLSLFEAESKGVVLTE
ncbi:MAG: DNA mismatch repair protein MutS [Cyanobacteria bacterium SZAS TMP-1]|nr:DNA mismatch repair protein MutS [Cyanobacteria bacterium SZAS TMP-1]